MGPTRVPSELVSLCTAMKERSKTELSDTEKSSLHISEFNRWNLINNAAHECSAHAARLQEQMAVATETDMLIHGLPQKDAAWTSRDWPLVRTASLSRRGDNSRLTRRPGKWHIHPSDFRYPGTSDTLYVSSVSWKKKEKGASRTI